MKTYVPSRCYASSRSIGRSLIGSAVLATFASLCMFAGVRGREYIGDFLGNPAYAGEVAGQQGIEQPAVDAPLPNQNQAVKTSDAPSTKTVSSPQRKELKEERKAQQPGSL